MEGPQRSSGSSSLGIAGAEQVFGSSSQPGSPSFGSSRPAVNFGALPPTSSGSPSGGPVLTCATGPLGSATSPLGAGAAALIGSGRPALQPGGSEVTPAAAASDALPVLAPPVGEGRLRSRLKQNLAIETTIKPQKVGSQVSKRILFRTLKEGETISQYYDFGKEIYSGGAKGGVQSAVRLRDKQQVVIKTRKKKPSSAGDRQWRAVMEQFCTMRDSKHVLDISEILEDDTAYYVIMPECDGGELFKFLVTEAEVPEAECKRIIREILTAVGHLHQHDLIHRDIKPENIMFDTDKFDAASPKTVKLIDFDTCTEWSPSTPKTRQFVGTPGYIAPEVLLGQASPLSDLWSIGVIMFILMTGETPWTTIETLEDGTVGSLGAKKMYSSIKTAVIDWEADPWPDFPLARDLSQKLMAFRPENRPASATEALAHPWLTEGNVE